MLPCAAEAWTRITSLDDDDGGGSDSNSGGGTRLLETKTHEAKQMDQSQDLVADPSAVFLEIQEEKKLVQSSVSLSLSRLLASTAHAHKAAAAAAVLLPHRHRLPMCPLFFIVTLQQALYRQCSLAFVPQSGRGSRPENWRLEESTGGERRLTGIWRGLAFVFAAHSVSRGQLTLFRLIPLFLSRASRGAQTVTLPLCRRKCRAGTSTYIGFEAFQ